MCCNVPTRVFCLFVFLLFAFFRCWREQWRPNLDRKGDVLDVAVEASEVLWPWSGYLAVTISVASAASAFAGTAEGIITFTVVSMLPGGQKISSVGKHALLPG